MDHNDLRGRYSRPHEYRFSVTLAPKDGGNDRIVAPITAVSAPSAKAKARRAHPGYVVVRCGYMGRA